MRQRGSAHMPVARLRNRDKRDVVGAMVLAGLGYLQLASQNVPHTPEEWFRAILGLAFVLAGVKWGNNAPNWGAHGKSEQAGAMRIVGHLMNETKFYKGIIMADAEQLPTDPKPIRDLIDKLRALIDEVREDLPLRPSQDLPGRSDEPLREVYKELLGVLAELVDQIQDRVPPHVEHAD